MKIQSAEIQMAGSQMRYQHISQRESLRISFGEQASRRPTTENTAALKPGTVGIASRVAISDAARDALQSAESAAVAANAAAESELDKAVDDPRMMVLIKVIEAMTGERVRIVRMNAGMDPGANKAAQARNSTAPDPNRQPFSFEYHHSRTVSTFEQAQFHAHGQVNTSDGRSINFEVALSMSRGTRFTESMTVTGGNAPQRKDPLVINLDATAAQLTAEKFQFDIDADGELDEISFTGPGSAFLVLDKNNNQRIDDGSELFGALTGDGFAELAAYDDDGNGWIDENDRIFADLRLWLKDDDGNDVLVPLATHDIGAIYLDRVDTGFELHDKTGTAQGEVLTTGLYLRESGQAGTIQQLDLYV